MKCGHSIHIPNISAPQRDRYAVPTTPPKADLRLFGVTVHYAKKAKKRGRAGTAWRCGGWTNGGRPASLQQVTCHRNRRVNLRSFPWFPPKRLSVSRLVDSWISRLNCY
jgi:hypothetical protein